MTPSSAISRRRLLQGGLAAGAISAVGLPTLTACSNEGRGGGVGGNVDNDAVQLPDYIEFVDGAQPDLIGENRVSNAFLSYPENPPSVSAEPPGDGQPISGFALINSSIPPSLDNNQYWQGLNERLGFELSMSLVPSADFSERFSTMVAGDQLPDVFTFFPGGAPSLPALLNEKAVDLTPLLAGAAIADYPFLANIPTDSWRQTVYGGKIYGVPIPRGAQISRVLYARQDLLAARGLDAAPQSWEEFYALCSEGRGERANAWALGEVPMTAIRCMFGIPNVWADEGGRLVSSYEAERQLEALEAGRRLVAEGLVHPDYPDADGTQKKTWLVNDTTFLMEETFTGWPSFFNYPISETFQLQVYAPPAADGGGPAPIWLGSPTNNTAGISKGSEDRVEALLSFLNYLAAPVGSAEHLYKTFGEEGVHHELQGTDPVLTDRGRSEIALGLNYLAEGPWTTFVAGRPEVAQAIFDTENAVVPSAVPNPALGLYSETESRQGVQLSTALSELEGDIIQGRQPVSAWAEAVRTWKADGGDTIRDELQRAYDQRAGS